LKLGEIGQGQGGILVDPVSSDHQAVIQLLMSRICPASHHVYRYYGYSPPSIGYWTGAAVSRREIFTQFILWMQNPPFGDVISKNKNFYKKYVLYEDCRLYNVFATELVYLLPLLYGPIVTCLNRLSFEQNNNINIRH
jgi:hypothetical protein